jgi:hypothetical protein
MPFAERYSLFDMVDISQSSFALASLSRSPSRGLPVPKRSSMMVTDVNR